MVIYFSGTGNSRYVAEYISAYLGNQECLDASIFIKNDTVAQLTKEHTNVFVCPIYAWRIPKVFEAFIKKAELSKGSKAYVVITCGANIGNAEDYVKKLCSDKGIEFMGVSQIVMPENYVAMFPVPTEEEATKIINNARTYIHESAQYIKENKMLPSHREGMIGWVQTHTVNPIFYKLCIKSKKFHATDLCVGCKKCVQLCPLNNIELVNGKPHWGKNCTHCMACICGCPTEAIEYGSKSQGKKRYKCVKFEKGHLK